MLPQGRQKDVNRGYTMRLERGGYQVLGCRDKFTAVGVKTPVNPPHPRGSLPRHWLAFSHGGVLVVCENTSATSEIKAKRLDH